MSECGRVSGGDEPAVRAPPDRALGGQGSEDVGRAELLDLGVAEGQLERSAQQLRAEHVRVGGVGDRRLDGLVEQRRRMVHEVGVEWIVAGDEHDQRSRAAAAGPAGLLPERRDGARESGDDDGVEAGDVHAEFECVGAGGTEQATVRQSRLELAPFLGEVAGAVRGDTIDEFGGRPRRAAAARRAR